MPTYIVQKGDTIPSIALATGFYWKTIWNHGNNAQLKEKRKNQNVLFPGDAVFIPELTPKKESRPTEARHRFRRKGDPIEIAFKLMKGGEPRKNEPYTLEIPPKVFEGSTDGEGVLKQPIPGNARRGVLKLDKGREVYIVRIGSLDPIDETVGVQQRLMNLNYSCRETGELDDDTVRALSKFQADHKLEVSGKIDDPTKAKLLSYGQ